MQHASGQEGAALATSEADAGTLAGELPVIALALLAAVGDARGGFLYLLKHDPQGKGLMRMVTPRIWGRDATCFNPVGNAPDMKQLGYEDAS